MVFPLRARVHNGRIVLDEPTDLPEGSEIDLLPALAEDALSAEERARLVEALEVAERELDEGKGISAEAAVAYARQLEGRV